MNYSLPKTFRPRSGAYFRKFAPGVDLPAEFLSDLRSIDTRLHLVWHTFKCELDSVMNEYEGRIDDPRFCIHEDYGEEVWGWVLKNPDNSPMRENVWHIWELHQHGWSHVCPVLGHDARYLQRLSYRLYLQNKIVLKYGPKKYFEMIRQGIDNTKEKEKQDLQDLNKAVMEENQWLVNAAVENLKSGRINATNPTKDIITSGSGLSNRSRITRPLTDTEGGLVLPDSWRQSA